MRLKGPSLATEIESNFQQKIWYFLSLDMAKKCVV